MRFLQMLQFYLCYGSWHHDTRSCRWLETTNQRSNLMSSLKKKRSTKSQIFKCPCTSLIGSTIWPLTWRLIILWSYLSWEMCHFLTHYWEMSSWGFTTAKTSFSEQKRSYSTAVWWFDKKQRWATDTWKRASLNVIQPQVMSLCCLPLEQWLKCHFLVLKEPV